MRKMTIKSDLPKNLPLLLKRRVLEDGELNLQAYKNLNGEYEYLTYKQVYSQVMSFALALRSIGIGKGDNVALISDNRQEWLITDFAIQSLGAADVPRGCDSTGNEIRFIINFADCKVGFFENEKQVLKILENAEEVPLLKKIVTFEELSETVIKELNQHGMEYYYYGFLLEEYKSVFELNPEHYTKEIEAEMETIEGDDVCTIIFTSGTTGTPKGVMLTHNNYISQFSAVHNYMPGERGAYWMSILPVWHSFERLAQYITILLHMGLAYSKPVARTLLKDMEIIKPYTMCGVPRLWEALATGIEKTMQKTGGATYKIYKFFMNVGAKYAYHHDYVTGINLRLTKTNKVVAALKSIIPLILLYPLKSLGNVLVYRKIISKFGGKFAYAISGGGALQKETDNFFRAINFKMLEGYGMTETAPAISFRDYKNPQPGVVGIVFPTIEAKIVKEENGVIVDGTPLKNGEKGLILIRGPHVMKGYYKRPDLTDAIIDKDGWLNTGDVGTFTFSGTLKITGRAKDTIVLLDGENIEPAGIEQALCASEFIETAMLVGQDRKFLSSLIVPVKDAVIAYAKEYGIFYNTYEQLLKNDKIYKMILGKVNSLVCVEKGFRNCEKISKIVLIAKTFEVGKELSAKQEVMRHKVVQEYSKEIDAVYA